MLSKEDASEMRAVFWTSFVHAMEKQRTVANRKINWANYPVKMRDVYVRMLADSNGAYWFFDIQHRDVGVRHLIYEQVEEFKGMLEGEMGELTWERDAVHNETSMPISRISKQLPGKSILKKSDWLEMHEFFRTVMTGFDKVWEDMGDVLRHLAK